MRFIFRVLFLLFVLMINAVWAQDDLKADAVQRVVRTHDPVIFTTTGALYVKQEALRAAGSQPLSAASQAEIERIIDGEVRDPTWFRAGLNAVLDRLVSAEEADEIASHFESEVGQMQRHIVELAIGEVLMSFYTFTDRIDHRLAGSERELRDVQAAVGARRGTCNCLTPQEADDLVRVGDVKALEGTPNLSKYPAAVKFASGGVGVKYMKVMVIQGVAMMRDHFEDVAKQVRQIAKSGR